MLQKVIAKILIYRREASTLFVSGIIMQKQGGEGREDRARSKRRGRAGQIVGFMDAVAGREARWRAREPGRGEDGAWIHPGVLSSKSP